MYRLIRNFILASRPKTLICSISPVIISFILSKSTNYKLFIVTLICSSLLQILANWCNDLFDFKKNTDTNREDRMLASKQITENQMKFAISILVIALILLGFYLILNSNYKILLIGLFSIIFAFGYTYGKYALAYLGLGEIAVLIFFGIVPVYGCSIIFNHTFSAIEFLFAMSPSFISTSLIISNNIRDIESDKLANKRTLATVIGKRLSEFEYLFFIYLSILIPVIYYMLQNIFCSIIFISYSYFTLKLTDILYANNYESLLKNTALLHIYFLLYVTILTLII